MVWRELTLVSRISPQSRSRTSTSCTPVTRSNKTSTTSNVPSTTQRVITARPRNRCGHAENFADRETHFYHTLTDTIITECVQTRCWNARGELARRRCESQTGEDRQQEIALVGVRPHLPVPRIQRRDPRGVEVLKENEWNTSKTCSQCGDDTKSNRKYRGLYVFSSCELVANADCNGRRTCDRR